MLSKRILHKLAVVSSELIVLILFCGLIDCVLSKKMMSICLREEVGRTKRLLLVYAFPGL